nr:nucleotidyltransferase domain-containing protein [uncultured Niameybacter sp.]
MNLDKAITQTIITLAKTYDFIDKVVLFGSRARGDNNPTSDIDLAIWGTENINEFAYSLDEQAPTLLEFDLSYMNDIEDDFFVEQILKEGIVLYEKSRL